MGRFTKLEFDSTPEPDRPGRPQDIGPDILFLQAEREYRDGNFEQALRYYSRALECDKLMVEAWRRQVVILIELAEFSEAALWADKASELFPNDPDLLAGKACALCRLGDVKQALKIVDRAIRLPGSSPYPWISRGEVLLATKEGRYDYCFSKAVTMAPTSWNVLAQVGRVYQYYGIYSKAIEYFKRSMGCDASVLFIYLETARCQKALGLLSHARAALQQLLRVNPKHFEARRELESLSSGTGRISGFFRRLFGR